MYHKSSVRKSAAVNQRQMVWSTGQPVKDSSLPSTPQVHD